MENFLINPISETALVVIYFFYGLAFFSMGLAIIIEGNRTSDERLRLSLRPLAGFGFIHGIHEWLDMFEHAGLVPHSGDFIHFWHGIKLIMLAFSFISLAGFGFSLLTPNLKIRRIALIGPIFFTAIWGFGILFLLNDYDLSANHFAIADVWTRYSLAIPAAIAAAVGMVVQQRTFRRAGMARFGRDALVASIAFAWYGVVGQVFTKPSGLWPSTILNSELFYDWFGFPVQLLRSGLAIIISVSVIRFMQAFDDEIQRQIDALRELREKEAREREALQVELFKRVISAQEAERQRIARELHDDTGQTLTAIGLGLRGINSMFEKNPKKASDNLEKLEGLTADSMVELQRMISNLRPAHLDDLGLASAIRWYVGKTNANFGLNFEFNVIGEEFEIPDSLSTAMYRMTQEAITNVIKHASAKNVLVELLYNEKEIGLFIKDDGIGMQKKDQHDSWGLIGMNERAALFGGKFSIKSAKGKGVQIRVKIPHEGPGMSVNTDFEEDQLIEDGKND